MKMILTNILTLITLWKDLFNWNLLFLNMYLLYLKLFLLCKEKIIKEIKSETEVKVGKIIRG